VKAAIFGVPLEPEVRRAAQERKGRSRGLHRFVLIERFEIFEEKARLIFSS